MKLTILPLVLSLASVAAYGQVTAFSNIGQTSDLTFLPGNDTPYGSPFTTGPTATYVNSVTGLFSNSYILGQEVSADIYTDNAGSIGTELYSLGTGYVPATTGNAGVLFNDYRNDVLAPNTTYWVVFGGYSPAHTSLNGGIRLDNTLDAPALAGWSKPNELQYVGQVVETGLNAQYALGVTAVPEVSSYGCATAAALAGWALVRRKKRA